MKNIIFKTVFSIMAVAAFWACSPSDLDDHSMNVTDATLPDTWNVTAVDNDNTLTIDFDPCIFIDGENIIGVQFFSEEAGVNITLKDQSTMELTQKVYRSGDYTLYVAPVTLEGIGVAREVPFTIVKNLMLETLSPAVLPEQVQFAANENAIQETFFKSDMYIEQDSEITLEGDIANDDVIVNLDFFERTSTTSVKFLGKSGVYTIYWNPLRKNVIIEPVGAPGTVTEPDYYVFTGMGIGYPTTVSSDDIKAAHGGLGQGRYTTWWEPGNGILSRVLLRNTGDGTYQGTVSINAGSAFKPFSNANFGNDTFAAVNCTFTGAPIFTGDGDWASNGNLDLENYYQITVNATTKAINIEKVDAAGNVIEEIPVDPNAPIVSDNFDATTGKVVSIGGKNFTRIFHTLEKDAEYTLKDDLASDKVIYNLDFFERVAVDKVKFLGESGDYMLYYSATGKFFTLQPEAPDYPNYMVAVGKGFAYPCKYEPIYTTAYPQNAKSTDILQYVLWRNTAPNTYQTTVMLKGGDGNLEFKGYNAAGGGNIINDWGNGAEYKFVDCTFTGEPGIFAGATDGNNWIAGANISETALYRVTLTITDEATRKANVDVQIVDWDGSAL